ncbi:MAG: UDP-N-acetylmuramate dehydrogenase [Desulfobacterales bacterium]
MDDLHKNWLNERFGRQVRFEEPMARHTWFRVGGPAEALVTPADTDALARLLTWCRAGRIPWLILGSGSNLLVKDGGIAGVVISLRRCLTKIESAGGGAGGRITAQAGVKLPVLCRYCIAHGFSGLNFALGIPATVGGAIVMNAGTARGSIADVLESLSCLHPDGRRVKFDRRELDFAYRRLALKPGAAAGSGHDPVIVDGTFALKPADKQLLANEAGRILKERAAKQPIDQPSAGCFFKNPPAGRSAGELIEKAGLKGRQIGSARVSEKHANFIVNAGGATARDILNLMDLVQGRVAAKFAVDLVPEVKIVGH